MKTIKDSFWNYFQGCRINKENFERWLFNISIVIEMKKTTNKTSPNIVLSLLDRTKILCIPSEHFLQETKDILTKFQDGQENWIISPQINSTKSKQMPIALSRGNSLNKADIQIILHDFRSHINRDIDFSIKSFLGKQSTLFNPGAGTNFIFKVDFPETISVDCDSFNAETYNGVPSKIAARISKIETLGGKISFDRIQSDCLTQNMRTIDGELPVILANALLYKYANNLSSWPEIISELNKCNPLGYRIAPNSPVYEVKIARFLQDAAMGMTPETPWSGFYDADGGQIIVKNDGEIVCYHIYELNRFRRYLLNATRIEQPSTGEDGDNPGHIRLDAKTGNSKKPYLFGWLYQEKGNYYFKINLQVRFKSISQRQR